MSCGLARVSVLVTEGEGGRGWGGWDVSCLIHCNEMDLSSLPSSPPPRYSWQIWGTLHILSFIYCHHHHHHSHCLAWYLPPLCTMGSFLYQVEINICFYSLNRLTIFLHISIDGNLLIESGVLLYPPYRVVPVPVMEWWQCGSDGSVGVGMWSPCSLHCRPRAGQAGLTSLVT